MIVYNVFQNIPYEGQTFQGTFSTMEKAKNYINLLCKEMDIRLIRGEWKTDDKEKDIYRKVLYKKNRVYLELIALSCIVDDTNIA